jgi:dolichol kinase
MYWFDRRKLIHISSLIVLPIEMMLGREITLVLISSITTVYALSEIFRLNKLGFPLIQSITTCCSEDKSLEHFVAEPVYFSAGLLLLLLFFPQTSFYLGSVALILGDGFAGLVGKKFGRNKIFYNKQKTVEGSLACFFATFFASIFIINFVNALIISVIATWIESMLSKYENLLLPLTIGFISWLIVI